MEKILVVEDSQIVQTLVRDILQAEYDLEFQDDGLSGLAAALRGQPDLILLDIQMPEMDGYEVCRNLKTNDMTKEIPIIFITSLDSEAEKVRGFEAGADDYVVKPFYNQELQARVKAQLSSHKAKMQALKLERLTVFKEMAVAISHEINNPLTAILAFLHHLQKELTDAPATITTSLEGIREETLRIKHITGKLAVAAKAEKIRYNEAINMINLHNL